jgi:hypothetical protein
LYIDSPHYANYISVSKILFYLSVDCVHTKDLGVPLSIVTKCNTLVLTRSIIMCPSRAICLPADCCFSELALWKSNWACWSSTKRTSSLFEYACELWDNWGIGNWNNFNWKPPGLLQVYLFSQKLILYSKSGLIYTRYSLSKLVRLRRYFNLRRIFICLDTLLWIVVSASVTVPVIQQLYWQLL